ncbi:N-terminal asparagine amidohydrolase-like protein [Circinella umbellata]|nr:N-terminal asparagine amidohydrolase-like protein [Circinella umbellata]
MKIACCQFTPVWGDPHATINLVDNLLSRFEPKDIDLLVLPEMAFTGYVFKNRKEIEPFLEDSKTGLSVTWAKKQAIRLHSYVTVGYPEYPGYNSLCCVDPKGQLIKTYQKSFLYETDEQWAKEGPGFVSMSLPNNNEMKIGLGICMDINPYQFKTPFENYEFARFHLNHDTELVICCMAWLQSQSQNVMDTIQYWAHRFLPLIQQEKKHVYIVICNRTGSERGSTFAGGSSVLQVGYNTSCLLDHMGPVESGVMIVNVDIDLTQQ